MSSSGSTLLHLVPGPLPHIRGGMDEKGHVKVNTGVGEQHSHGTVPLGQSSRDWGRVSQRTARLSENDKEVAAVRTWTAGAGGGGAGGRGGGGAPLLP